MNSLPSGRAAWPSIVAVVVGCALPLLALVVYFVLAADPAAVLQEGGVWSIGVLAATMLFSFAPTALAGVTAAPRLLWGMLAVVPFGVGVAGTLASRDLVATAIASVSPADKMMLASVGTAEAASIFALALVVGGAGIAGFALVVLVVERGPGAALLLAQAGAAMVLGVRWLLLREVLAAVGRGSPADQMTILASSVPAARWLGLAVVGVGVLLLVGGLLSLLRRGAWAPVSSTLGLSVGALLVALATVAVHLSLSGLTAAASQTLPPQPLAHFGGAATDVPGLFIKAGRNEGLPGSADAAVVASDARGIDVRRGLASVLADGHQPATMVFVGPSGADPVVDTLLLPLVLQPLMRDRRHGISTTLLLSGPCPIGGAHWPCGNDDLQQVIVLGPRRTSADLGDNGPRYLLRSADAELDLKPGRVALAFDDDVDASTFASVLSRLAKRRIALGDGVAGVEVNVIAAAPPSSAELQRAPATVDVPMGH